MALQGQVALITGGGKNLGARKYHTHNRIARYPARLRSVTVIAHQLAGEGASLALHYNSPSSKDETMKLCEELSKKGTKVSVHVGDLTTAAAVEKLFADVLAEHKKLNIVVNTVGMVLKKAITEISEAEYDKMFAYDVSSSINDTLVLTFEVQNQLQGSFLRLERECEACRGG